MVSCDVTGGITLETKLKMPISKPYVMGMRLQIELTKISVTKGWSDQEVNAQIDKDLNP